MHLNSDLLSDKGEHLIASANPKQSTNSCIYKSPACIFKPVQGVHSLRVQMPVPVVNMYSPMACSWMEKRLVPS